MAQPTKNAFHAFKDAVTDKVDKLMGGGNEFKKEDETRWAHCVMKPTKDNKALVVREEGLQVIAGRFNIVVAAAGPAGRGKSTFCSTAYNVERGDKVDYFEASDAVECWTTGLWALNANTKAAKNSRDKVDMLDLQGLNDKDANRYLVVIAMTLSNAMLLFSGGRIEFALFEALEVGVRMFQELGIKTLKPILYVEVPFGKKQFKVKGGQVFDKKGLIAYIKEKHATLNDFEMRTFSLPRFNEDEDENRFESRYVKSVESLVEELKSIENRISCKIEDRVKYARVVVQALNNNSPSMVNDLNLQFLRNQVARIRNIKESRARETLKLEGLKALPLKTRISYKEFCALVCPSGRYGYADGIKHEAMSLPYYVAESKEQEAALSEIEEKCFIDPRAVLRDVYDQGLNKLEQDLLAKKDKLMKADLELFESFVELEISRYRNKIEFNGSTYLPHALVAKVDAKRHELRTNLIVNTQNVSEVPDDYLNKAILTTRWETAMNTLKERWETRKLAAIGDRKVVTEGDLKCPKCKREHSGDKVHHGKCGSESLWYRVDDETKYAVCSICKDLQRVTSVCCWSCETTLNARVVW